ncbi:hypothetical protein [Kitasatospora sp. NPDC059327]|uniref:hypothetical protein n=1 Tax=Kitasatospora sp. NPDC059327 TaxID=3346803 RepID=UPI0036C06F9F
MTGGNERDSAADPLSGMSEAAPDDLFTGRSRPAGRKAARAAASHSGDDDLYGSSAAVAPAPDDDEPPAERPGTGR